MRFVKKIKYQKDIASMTNYYIFKTSVIGVWGIIVFVRAARRCFSGKGKEKSCQKGKKIVSIVPWVCVCGEI